MKFLKKWDNFLHPEKEVKKFIDLIKQQDDEIKLQDKKIKILLEEFKEEEQWRTQYTDALSLLTKSMQSMVWQKDNKHRYVLANPTHCESFFGFEGTPECLQSIIGRTDTEIIDKMFVSRKVKNTFGKMCVMTDSFVSKKQIVTHFFEKGIVEGIEVLLYIVKIPQFDSGKLTGTMGIGWDFSERMDEMLIILDRWKSNNEAKTLHKDAESFCYLIEPESKQCDMFHHICPWIQQPMNYKFCGVK